MGEDLLAIPCIWVHGYDHHIGNRQGKGYGRYILELIEKDAVESGAAGMVAWARRAWPCSCVSACERGLVATVPSTGAVPGRRVRQGFRQGHC